MEKKMFGYSIRDYGELMVGVVMARDIEEAKKIIQVSFRLDDVDDADFTTLEFSSSGICEIYYGT